MRIRSHRGNDLSKLNRMIQSVKIAMLTTIDDRGTLHSRPMATHRMRFDGDLWFLTSATAPKVSEVNHNRHVSVTFSSPGDQRYVSVSGSAELVRDRLRVERFWKSAYKAWFPKGRKDPDLALLRVTIEKAEYWDAKSSKVVQLIGMARSLATGRPYEAFDHRKVQVHSGFDEFAAQ